jgi:hypothetical protein
VAWNGDIGMGVEARVMGDMDEGGSTERGTSKALCRAVDWYS